ncbi:hypothetical protein GH714_038514 [Hevea brasiliensis]|uniref:Ribosome production factor 2 homolog n=1 Tax=Hevea brasiliensis TaxID=3981 RepID=A0A6A6KLB9_HEVBR|nr:hypothetical protein GH714_038514 [Hevea brasiliensis]
MLKAKTPKKGRIKRELEKRAPKLVETGKKTLILQGTKMSRVLNAVLADLYLKRESAIRYTRKNDNIRPFESGGESSLEFFSQKTDCSIFLVVENLNLTGLDRAYVCTAVSSNRVFLTHCAIRLKKSGTIVPHVELVEVGPSMDLVARRHRLPNESLRKEAMKTAKDRPKKKIKNVSADAIQGKVGKIYIPDQKIGDMALPNKSKGVKRERREAKMKNGNKERASKKQKEDSE